MSISSRFVTHISKCKGEETVQRKPTFSVSHTEQWKCRGEGLWITHCLIVRRHDDYVHIRTTEDNDYN